MKIHISDKYGWVDVPPNYISAESNHVGHNLTESFFSSKGEERESYRRQIINKREEYYEKILQQKEN